MKYVVLLSGGIDSSVLLADLVNRGHDCVALTLNYGQTHVREVQSAMAIAKHFDTPIHVHVLPRVFDGSSSALLSGSEIPETHADSIDSTYVPGRNIVMLATAAATADAIGSPAVFMGATVEDAAGYPDCRPRFLAAMSDATFFGTKSGVMVYAPFASMPKSDVVALGRELGVPLDQTWSCYRRGTTQCGRCGACELRQKALQ